MPHQNMLKSRTLEAVTLELRSVESLKTVIQDKVNKNVDLGQLVAEVEEMFLKVKEKIKIII